MTPYRFMRPREQTEADGIPALARLIKIAHGDSGQCGRVRSFLLGLYNGGTFPFDLTDLRALDRDIQEDAIAVLVMDMTPSVEVHHRIPGVSGVIATWAKDEWPAAQDEDRCSNPAGHKWAWASHHGEGRCYCIYCGVDGDA